MATHTAIIRWTGSPDDDFAHGKYSRAHEWRFDGGAVVRGSSSPSVVPLPWSDAGAVDPEEAFVASLSACHMLFFLDFARRAGAVVTAYEDAAEGVMAKGADGKVRITTVTLRPRVEFAGEVPDLNALHHAAHEACFIANSVTCDVVMKGR